MRTARLSTVSQHALLGGTCPGDSYPGGVPAWGVCLPREVYLLRRDVPAQGSGGVPAGGGVPAQGGVPAWEVYLPRGVYLSRREVPAQVLPPLWTEWQTGTKILPYPKLRLRAVIKRWVTVSKVKTVKNIKAIHGKNFAGHNRNILLILCRRNL